MSRGRTFSFETSWGANYSTAGTRFRLWAPGAATVELMSGSEEASVSTPMQKAQGGWWEVTIDRLQPGSGYGFRVDGGKVVPDPAARAQMGDVHGRSKLIDPHAYQWKTAHWKGRPWHETIFYELHTGTFTPEGTFDAVIGKLEHLQQTGITAIEIMPVAQFGGRHGWGYDGVLLYCPHAVYGGAEGLKRLVDGAHARGLMVFLDVVYNHFGPDGNYIPSYLPEFFHADVQTPWGAAIAYDQEPVRRFMIENALYWLTEYRLDGLRLDAIDSIKDTTGVPLVKELAARVREVVTDRHVHITTEDDRNITWHIERNDEGSIPLVSGEWNDDFHHTAHAIATNEQEAYYQDYEIETAGQMARALATGFVFQGDYSRHRSREVGDRSAHLPPTAFVHFIQNHDQIGNRAFGDRLRALSSARAYDCMQAILLLSPQIPLMFQGDEFGDPNSFCFFTDFHGDLGKAVSKGRKEEFKYFSAFEDERAGEVFPDPNDEATFLASKLDWSQLSRPIQRRRLQVTQELLSARRAVVIPLLEKVSGGCGSASVDGRALAVTWKLRADKTYHLFANLDDKTGQIEGGRLGSEMESVELVYSNHRDALEALRKGELPAWTAAFVLARSPRVKGRGDG
jgi:malto-oligosyltrehalose trehalohydrolase